MPKYDNLDMLIMMAGHVLVEKNEEEFLRTDTSDVVVPRSLDRRIYRMIRRERRRREYGAVLRVLNRAAIIVLVTCIITIALMLSVEAVRVAVWNAVMEWFDKYITITYEADEDTPDAIMEKHKPRDIPADWVEEVVVEDNGRYKIRYLLNDEYIGVFTQTIKQTLSGIDNENISHKIILINSAAGTLFYYVDHDEYIVKWSDENYSYSLGINKAIISFDEVIEMVEAIK